MIRLKTICIFLFCLSFLPLRAALQPGFDKAQYLELLRVNAGFVDNPQQTFPQPEHFVRLYSSPAFAMDNKYELWYDAAANTACISLRGTTARPVSWLENFYAAMVPARGAIVLAGGNVFEYDFSADSRAAVHAGWTAGTGYIYADLKPRLDSIIQAGVRDVIITGHSQGGALAFLLTALLRRMQSLGNIPRDLRFKTYASAGPKPGNLYFAYDYERQTQNGWAFNVVNAADWVPETPVSIQTLSDFNTTNPFKNAKKLIKKQKFPQNIVLKHIFNQLDRPTTKARKKYQKYLGGLVGRFIEKQAPGSLRPEFFPCNNFVRTGTTIVLYPDTDYYSRFPDSEINIFVHHMFEPYYELAQKLDI